ncbi:MAG TPA: zinc ABC transporter substrate-binding protein [Acetobacteraceae bacterium]|nr:zinc ABC transporter substrate-binding protein [Acetobacteraceae bacterium]
MLTPSPRLLLAALLLLAASLPARAAAPVAVVAAESVYGDVARQIGGAAVRVTSILSNPDQDPHMFEASPSVARALAGARIAVMNGIGYDPWMAKLLAATRAPGRTVITVAALAGHRPGDNPHVWYDLPTMRAYADALARALEAADPAHAADFRNRLAEFDASLRPVADRIAALKSRLAGTPVTATEPVFGYVFAAIGLTVRNMAFQMAVMNDTEPAMRDVAAFERDLKTHAVRLLVYNSQASTPVAARMAKLARHAGVPVVGVTETEPPGRNFQSWMLEELDAVARALP